MDEASSFTRRVFRNRLDGAMHRWRARFAGLFGIFSL
jgi:hypothetical protein